MLPNLSAIYRAKFYLSNTILLMLAYLAMLFILQMKHTADFVNNSAKEMEFGSPGGRGDDEHNSIVLVEITKIFTTQDDVFFGKILFDEVQVPAV